MKSEAYSRQELSSWLPLYLNGSLDADKRLILESWLDSDPQAGLELEVWRQVRSALASQPRPALSQHAWRGINQTIQAGKPPVRHALAGAAAGILLAALSLVVLWLAIRPGVALEWSVRESVPVTFRIYRAPAGGGEFALVKELPGQPGVSQYRYLDMLFVPGRAYIYHIEAVDQGHVVVSSQPVISHTNAALPGQAAILVSSLLVGLLAASTVRTWRQNFPGRQPAAC